jgi:hypothetical protein
MRLFIFFVREEHVLMYEDRALCSWFMCEPLIGLLKHGIVVPL